jgi:hypothetical protein
VHAVTRRPLGSVDYCTCCCCTRDGDEMASRCGTWTSSWTRAGRVQVGDPSRCLVRDGRSRWPSRSAAPTLSMWRTVERERIGEHLLVTRRLVPVDRIVGAQPGAPRGHHPFRSRRARRSARSGPVPSSLSAPRRAQVCPAPNHHPFPDEMLTLDHGSGLVTTPARPEVLAVLRLGR